MKKIAVIMTFLLVFSSTSTFAADKTESPLAGIVNENFEKYFDGDIPGVFRVAPIDAKMKIVETNKNNRAYLSHNTKYWYADLELPDIKEDFIISEKFSVGDIGVYQLPVIMGKNSKNSTINAMITSVTENGLLKIGPVLTDIPVTSETEYDLKIYFSVKNKSYTAVVNNSVIVLNQKLPIDDLSFVDKLRWVSQVKNGKFYLDDINVSYGKFTSESDNGVTENNPLLAYLQKMPQRYGVGNVSEALYSRNCFRKNSEIVIDGEINEASWNGSWHTVEKCVIGDTNTKVYFNNVWDDEYLYLASKIYDTSLTQDSKDSWHDDSIEIHIDTDNNKLAKYDENDRKYIYVWKSEFIKFNPPKSDGTGVEISQKTTDYGWNVEFKIPWSNIGKKPETGDKIGFDIGYNDDNDGGNRDAQLMWGGTANNSNDTSAFGTLTLTDTIKNSDDDTVNPFFMNNVILANGFGYGYTDGIKKYFDLNNENLMVIKKDDTFMIPLRFICNSLGYNVKWDFVRNCATVSFKGNTAEIFPKGNVAVNNSRINPEFNSNLIMGNLFVPVSWLKEIFNANYSIQDNKYIIIRKNDNTQVFGEDKLKKYFLN